MSKVLFKFPLITMVYIFCLPYLCMAWDTISHVVIHSSNIKASKLFYGKLCKFLGLKEILSDKTHVAYANESFSLWITQRPIKKGKPVRGSIAGYDHMAFSATSKNQVDALQMLLDKERFRVLYPAEVHPEYSPGYYSVSFFDPDDTILEFVYLPKSKNTYG